MTIRWFYILLVFVPLFSYAQGNFGYYSHSELLKQHPRHSSVEADYNDLLVLCNKEVERNERELTRLYVSFLEGQKSFPEPIMRKRQKELQELVDKSVVFRKQIKEWLVEARDSLYSPLDSSIDSAVAKVCQYNNLAYVIDVDKAGYAYVNPAYGFDVTAAVLSTLANNGIPQKVYATGHVNAPAPIDEENALPKDSVKQETATGQQQEEVATEKKQDVIQEENNN
ncbi:MAG: OmpH family outer membrane protein [Bacteroidaceae bacterium]|nr:OmpH family outer membrane protein [Bacteroidaceae bacterium]